MTPRRRARPGTARTKSGTAGSPAIPDALVRAARDSSRRSAALSPRSPRGAALLTRGGAVFHGCDLEAPEPSGLATCAERAAVRRAVMEGKRRFLQLLIRGGRNGEGDGGAPCGACLQVLCEFSPTTRIWWGTASRLRGGRQARELLPGAFRFAPPPTAMGRR